MLLVVFGEGEQATMWITFPAPLLHRSLPGEAVNVCSKRTRLRRGVSARLEAHLDPACASPPAFGCEASPSSSWDAKTYLGWLVLQGESEAIVNVDYCLEWNCHHHRTRELPATPL